MSRRTNSRRGVTLLESLLALAITGGLLALLSMAVPVFADGPPRLTPQPPHLALLGQRQRLQQWLHAVEPGTLRGAATGLRATLTHPFHQHTLHLRRQHRHWLALRCAADDPSCTRPLETLRLPAGAGPLAYAHKKSWAENWEDPRQPPVLLRVPAKTLPLIFVFARGQRWEPL